jgi:hypothetical protein
MEEHDCIDDMEEERLDPNKLFCSPYKQEALELADEDTSYIRRTAHGDESISLHSDDHSTQQKTQSPNLSKTSLASEMRDFLQLSRIHITEFWSRHKDRFVSFWRSMTPESRENFLRQVYPFIIQELGDSYCWVDFKKQYRHDYEQILVLSPYLNVVDLIYQDHLINLLDKYSLENVLVNESAELVLRVRNLHANNVLPLTAKEQAVYTRSTNMKRGDSLLLSDPVTLEYGEVVTVDNPRTVLLPTGGEAHKLYKSGHLTHPIEFQKVTENIAFIATLLNDVLSVFTTDVLNKDVSYARSMTALSLHNSCTSAQDGTPGQMMGTSLGQATPIQSILPNSLLPPRLLMWLLKLNRKYCI